MPSAFESIKPEPITAQLKIIIFGPTWLMHVFSMVDDEFAKLFKIRGEILPRVKRSKEQERAYRTWLQSFTEKEGIHSFTDEAAAALIEYAGRLADDQEHLSIDFETLSTIVQEANTLIDEQAPNEENKRVDRPHVAKAIQQCRWRSDASYEKRLEHIRSGDLLITTDGKEIGQINALTVSGAEHGIKSFCHSAVAPFTLSEEKAHELMHTHPEMFDTKVSSDIAFGGVVRVTALASVGKFAIQNIHKEVDWAGPVFRKADLTVQGLLRKYLAQELPLEMHITFAFEQMYGGIEGDSASLVQFYAIMSALAKIPILQNVALTGSVNQHGDIQPIGGVNEKSEGFFDTCRAKGELTGKQGVLIPHQNIQDLMLNAEVEQAVLNKKFSVWPLYELEEGPEYLMDVTWKKLLSEANKGVQGLVQNMKNFYVASPMNEQ
jgi:predicted ATP-dependent protease